MKKSTTITFSAFIAIAVAFSACKKSSSTSVTPTTTTSTPSPTVADVDGGLVSLKVKVTTVTAGVPFTLVTETGLATFFSATGNNSSFVDGGTVSVNSNSLDKQSNNSYLKTASLGMTPADLGFGTNSSNWSVGGAGSVPAFTYNDNAAFPDFTGTVPDSVVRSAGVTISLGGNTTNADSVLLFIASGSKSITRTFAGTATSATLSSSDLSAFSAVSDKSAIMEVVPYRYTVNTQGGKKYAFIKELAVVKSINIQ